MSLISKKINLALREGESLEDATIKAIESDCADSLSRCIAHRASESSTLCAAVRSRALSIEEYWRIIDEMTRLIFWFTQSLSDRDYVELNKFLLKYDVFIE